MKRKKKAGENGWNKEQAKLTQVFLEILIDSHELSKATQMLHKTYISEPRTTVSQDVQTRFPVELAFAKFLSKIKGNFWGSAVSMILALY